MLAIVDDSFYVNTVLILYNLYFLPLRFRRNKVFAAKQGVKVFGSAFANLIYGTMNNT